MQDMKLLLKAEKRSIMQDAWLNARRKFHEAFQGVKGSRKQ